MWRDPKNGDNPDFLLPSSLAKEQEFYYNKRGNWNAMTWDGASESQQKLRSSLSSASCCSWCNMNMRKGNDL